MAEPPNKRSRQASIDPTTTTTSSSSWLICPVCLGPPETTPIQCRNGHILCAGACSVNLDSCPTCRTPMDRNNPIRCLVATQYQEHEAKNRLHRCRGGVKCGWTGSSELLLLAHEEQCLHAAHSKIAELQSKQKDLDDVVRSLQKQVGRLEEERRESKPNHDPDEKLGGSLMKAAWHSCVLQYQAKPLAGATIWVRDPNAEDEEAPQLVPRPWLQLRCIVPGISYLDREDTENKICWDVFYDPIQQRVADQIFFRWTKSSGEFDGFSPMTLTQETVCPEGEERGGEFTLRRVLVTLQYASILLFQQDHSRDGKPSGSFAFQKQKLCKLADNGVFDPSTSAYMTLEASTTNLDLSTCDTRDDWELLDDKKAENTANDRLLQTRFPRCLPGHEMYNPLIPSTFHISKTIRIANVPYRCKDNDIRGFFERNGFTPCIVYKDRRYKTDKAEVTMNSYTDAMKAVESLHGKLLMGRVLELSFGS